MVFFSFLFFFTKTDQIKTTKNNYQNTYKQTLNIIKLFKKGKNFFSKKKEKKDKNRRRKKKNNILQRRGEKTKEKG